MASDPQQHSHDDDKVDFPELDDDDRTVETDDFGAHDQLAFDEDPNFNAEVGLEEGVDEPVEVELDTLEDEAVDWTADPEGDTDLLDQALGLSEIPDAAAALDCSDDSEGLPEAGHDFGLQQEFEVPPVADDGDEGLELDLGSELPELPQFDSAADEGEEGFSGSGSFLDPLPLPGKGDEQEGARMPVRSRPPLPRRTRPPKPKPAPRRWSAVAPGIRWRRLTDVEIVCFDRPQGRAEFGLHAVCRGVPLIYLGELYRVQGVALRPMRAMGLRPNPLALCAAGRTSPILWAIHRQGAQLSQDGGATFSPPVPLPRRRGSVQGAATADGTLWMIREGELFRLGLSDLMPRPVACEEPPIEVVSDGHNGLLIVGLTGHLFVSSDGGRRFSTWPGPETPPQVAQLCGGMGLLMTTSGHALVDQRGYRHLFTGSAHLGTLAEVRGGLHVYAIVRTGEGWLLVRIPARPEKPRDPVVVGALPADVGAPRFLLVYAERDSTAVLVGADHAFIQLNIPFETDV